MSKTKKGDLNMKHSNKIVGAMLSLLTVIFLAGCGGGESSQTNTSDGEGVTQDDIVHDYKIDLLKDETYYFPANTPNDDKVDTQPLKQFDFIFVGHNPNTVQEGQINTDVIPGTYMHMLMYIGKDSNGLAYGIEMNIDADPELEMNMDGTIHLDGQLNVYCLGSDYNKECPKDEYVWGLESYDYMWAKRLTPQLHDNLTEHKNDLMAQIKNDLETKFPFQLPFNLDFFKYDIKLINDGRQGGADCAAYMTLLLEEVAGVCMDDIHMDAEAMEDYYINDPRGQEVHIPAEDNPYSDEDAYISDLLDGGPFSIVDNPPRQTICPDGRKAVGIPTPNKIFNSPSMVEIAVE